MGQKVNPIGLRLGINKTWQSRWYARSADYAEFLHEDLNIRKVLLGLPECQNAGIAEVSIIRHPQRVTVAIHTARPAVIIGLKGANVEQIGARLQAHVSKKLQIKVIEIKRAEVNANLVAQNIARQLAGRSSFRKVVKQSASGAIKGGCQGIKIRLSGRLGGAEMSRTDEYKEGRVPLHTLRADVDFGFAESLTTFGKIGVKVWIFNGMMYGKDHQDDAGQLMRKPRERRNPSDNDRSGRSSKAKKEASEDVEKKSEGKSAKKEKAADAKSEKKTRSARASKSVKEVSDGSESQES